jgi:hypothetical protein
MSGADTNPSVVPGSTVPSEDPADELAVMSDSAESDGVGELSGEVESDGLESDGLGADGPGELTGVVGPGGVGVAALGGV